MRQPKPFYRKSTQSYYVKIKGKFIPLGKDEAKANEEYHKVMAGRQPVTVDSPVINLVAQFLTYCQSHKKSSTFKWYRQFLRAFVALESIRTLSVANLKKRHVQEFADGYASPAGRRAAIVSVKCALNWAVEIAELIPANPIKKLKSGKPPAREVYIKPEQWQAVLSAVDDSDPFKEILLFMKATGCRPGEATVAGCHHADLTRKVVVLGIEEWKCGRKTGKKRTIYLNDDALALVQLAYMRAGQDGLLFRNRKGQPFSIGWIGKKCSSIEEKLQKQFGPKFKFFAYAIRHTWITDKLKQGIDVCTVAKLAGTSAEMVQEVYCQLGLNEDHLHNAARTVAKVVAS
jgi:integrase